MPTLLDEFAGLTKALHERQIEYAVCGGWAMAILGFPRATVDIDLLIPPGNLDDVFEVARSLGYDITGTPLSLSDGEIEIRRISKVDPETQALFTLDFLLVTAAVDKVWRERRLFHWNLGTVTCVSREGLIDMKKISGRLIDLADIEKLESGK